jgi:hypothetical protein
MSSKKKFYYNNLFFPSSTLLKPVQTEIGNLTSTNFVSKPKRSIFSIFNCTFEETYPEGPPKKCYGMNERTEWWLEVRPVEILEQG